MPYSTSVIRLLEKVEPSTREVLIAVLEEIERIEQQREQSVTKNEFNELKNIVADLTQTVKELAESQKKTEQRVNELAEAQKQTEQAVKELIEAQKKSEQRLAKTEQRLDKLEQTVAELAEAQKQTEQRLNELAEAQKQTEKQVKKLAEDLAKLAGEHRKTREQLGGLQHTVGYILEDRALVGLPPLLESELGLKLTSPLKRDYLEISPGRFVEINIIGKAIKDGQQLLIIGECKSQLKKKDVDDFLKNLNRLKEALNTEILPLLVTYQASPQVRNYAKQKGLRLYFSYQFPL